MGIYDREYYRREGPSLFASLTEHGKVCKWLIVINVVVYVLQMLSRHGPGPSLVEEYAALNATQVLQGEVWRLLSYAFLHDEHAPWHILWNMLFLWWFGCDVEDIYGKSEFLALYLVSAVLGGLAFVATQLAQVTNPDGVCVGASGAVTTVMMLCALHFPHRVILLFFLLPVPIWLIVLYQVVKDSFVFLSGINDGTAVQVHLAGAALGFAYFKFQWRVLNWFPNLRGWRRRARPKLRIHREEPAVVASAAAPRPEPAGGDVDEQLEAKLDAVLEKMARHGQGSLTETEKQILFRASEVYRKRRT